MIEPQGSFSVFVTGNTKAVVEEAALEEMEDDVGVITQDTNVMDSQTNFMEIEYVQSLEEFMEDIEYETWVSKSNKKKQPKKTKGRITIATRTSSRVPKGGRTMMEKEMNSLKTWAVLLKETDRVKMKETAQSLSDWMKTKAYYTGPITDIVVL